MKGGMGNLFKQAQQMQEKLAAMQEKLAELRVDGQAAGGMLRVTLDGKLLGRSDSTEPFYWTPEPGRFTVRAVDGHGRSDAEAIRVVVVE